MNNILHRFIQHCQHFLIRHNTTNVASNLSNQRITSQEWFYALAPGNPEQGKNILLSLNAYKHNPQLSLFPQDEFSPLYILSFKWLADIDACQKHNPQHTSISANTACALLKHSLPSCKKAQEAALISPHDASLAILRIIRTFASAHLFLKDQHKKTPLFSHAIQSALYDLHILRSCAWHPTPTLPLFIRIDILILLSLCEHLATCRQNTYEISDQWLNQLSIQIKKNIEKSHSSPFKEFLNPQPSSRYLNFLSQTLNTFFLEENGTASFASHPAIYAHTFVWLSLINMISERYNTSLVTISQLLPQLLHIIKCFCHSHPEKNTQNLFPAFLTDTCITDTRLPSLFSQHFMPISEQSLSFFCKKNPPHNEQNLKPIPSILSQMGYAHLFSSCFSLHIHIQPFAATQHTQHPLDNFHEHHTMPSYFHLHAGRKNDKQPLFSQSSPSPKHLPFLRSSGLGLHKENAQPIPFSPENFSSTPPENTLINFNEIYQLIPRSHLTHIKLKTPPPSENTVLHTTHIHFTPINLKAKRQTLFTKKYPFLIGIDTFLPSRNPTPSPFFFHIAFFCPQPCLVSPPTPNHHSLYIQQPIEKTKYVWSLQLLPSPSNHNLKWECLPHQKGTWIYLADVLPSENTLSIPWILKLEKNINQTPTKNTQLSLNL